MITSDRHRYLSSGVAESRPQQSQIPGDYLSFSSLFFFFFCSRQTRLPLDFNVNFMFRMNLNSWLRNRGGRGNPLRISACKAKLRRLSKLCKIWKLCLSKAYHHNHLFFAEYGYFVKYRLIFMDTKKGQMGRFSPPPYTDKARTGKLSFHIRDS